MQRQQGRRPQMGSTEGQCLAVLGKVPFHLACRLGGL